MVYPELSNNVVSILLYEQAFNSYYDIAWSFDYYLEDITEQTEVGFCFFLQQADIPIYGGGYGTDLGYSGLSANNDGTFSSFLSAGLSGAVVGIGLDSTGSFALSASDSNRLIRDGLADASIIPNSITVRLSAPSYNFSSCKAITAFDLVDSERKTLRARIGNLGRTIYVDWRRTPADTFENILTQNITLGLPVTAMYRPGVSINKPILSISEDAIPTIVIENFHIEGNDEIPNLDTTPLPDEDASCIKVPELCPPPVPPTCEEYPELCPISGCIVDCCSGTGITPLGPKHLLEDDNICVFINAVSAYVEGYIENTIDIDEYNIGYSLSAIELDATLYRTDDFLFINDDETITITRDPCYGAWKLNAPLLNTHIGTSRRPVGEFIDETSIINVVYL